MDHGVRTLVVEDESVVALDIQGRLERLGYATPATAGSAEEALELASLDATIQVATYKREMAAKLAAQREQLELRVRELTALNELFQQHLIERFEVTDAYRQMLTGLEGLAKDTSALVDRAKSLVLPDLSEVAHGLIQRSASDRGQPAAGL